jgi:hypothetical protein
MIALVALPAMLSGALSAGSSQETSPGGRYTLNLREEVMPGAAEDEDHAIVLLDGTKEIARHPISGTLLEQVWSPGGQWVAFNNRWANGGDCVWILSLKDGRILKKARDQFGEEIERAALEAIRKIEPAATEEKFDRSRIDAMEWVSDSALKVRVGASYAIERGGFFYSPIIDVSDDILTLRPAVVERLD